MRSLHTRDNRWGPIIAMAVIAAACTALQHRPQASSEASGPERAARAVVWPVQSALVSVGWAAGNVASAALRGGELARENERLRRQVAELESQRLAMWSCYLENKAIKRDLGWEGGGPPETTVAQVVGWSPGGQNMRVTIQANRELERGNVVKTEAGLVGRVIEAQGRRGVVVLLLDAQHAVAAKLLKEKGDHGIVYAAPDASEGRQVLELSKLPPGADVEVGDRVVSSGVGSVYPAGLPIGVVQRVERSPVNAASKIAYLLPYADFHHLDFVQVIRRGE